MMPDEMRAAVDAAMRPRRKTKIILLCGDCDADWFGASVKAAIKAGWREILQDSQVDGQDLWWTHIGTCPDCWREEHGGGTLFEDAL